MQFNALDVKTHSKRSPLQSDSEKFMFKSNTVKDVLALRVVPYTSDEMIPPRSAEAAQDKRQWREHWKAVNGHKKQLSSIEDTNNENVSEDEFGIAQTNGFVLHESLQHSRSNSAFNQDQ